MTDATCHGEIILTLPDGPCEPVSVNSIPSHPMERARMKTKFVNPVTTILRSQFNSKGMTALTPPVELYIVYTFKEHRSRDRDNYTSGSTKWLIDILKGWAWNGDDDSETMDLRPVELIVTGEAKTIIRICEK